MRFSYAPRCCVEGLDEFVAPQNLAQRDRSCKIASLSETILDVKGQKTCLGDPILNLVVLAARHRRLRGYPRPLSFRHNATCRRAVWRGTILDLSTSSAVASAWLLVLAQLQPAGRMTPSRCRASRGG
eukprot:scaffold14211_cov32-Prasinocladus_malaysianus.AAC.1